MYASLTTTFTSTKKGLVGGSGRTKFPSQFSVEQYTKKMKAAASIERIALNQDVLKR